MQRNLHVDGLPDDNMSQREGACLLQLRVLKVSLLTSLDACGAYCVLATCLANFKLPQGDIPAQSRRIYASFPAIIRCRYDTETPDQEPESQRCGSKSPVEHRIFGISIFFSRKGEAYNQLCDIMSRCGNSACAGRIRRLN
jgi:hypothetical protein